MTLPNTERTMKRTGLALSHMGFYVNDMANFSVRLTAQGFSDL